MFRRIATVTCVVLLGLCAPEVALAQTSIKTLARVFPVDEAGARSGTMDLAAPQTPQSEAPSQTATASDDLKISIYPILLWVPAFTAKTTVPAFPDEPDGPDLPGGSGRTSTSLNGAALAGFSIEKANWRIDGDGIWAALVTQRDRPLLRADLDVIYGHVSGGVKVYKGFYVTGGVRRLALK